MITNSGCNTDGPPSDIFDGKVIASNDGGGIITVSFTETITTSLCLTISLVDSTGKVLDTKTLTDTVSDSSMYFRPTLALEISQRYNTKALTEGDIAES